MNLFKNESGRYVLDGYELTSGDVIEVKRGEQWEGGRVEFSWERQDYVVLLALGGVIQITPDILLRRPDGTVRQCVSEEGASVNGKRVS
jgi:hypothetical protein